MSLDRAKVCQELKVLKRIQETVDTVSFVLEVPRTSGGRYTYKAGQFVTFFMDIGDEEVRRSYSLASSPDFESEFKVSVKLVPGGKGSTYLFENVREGDTLWTTPPAGHFCLPNGDIENTKFGFYAAGSGITPIISIIKTILKTTQKSTCSLLYQNRRETNVIFKSELAKLEKEFGDRLRVEHIISQPEADWPGLKGRVDDKVLRDFLTRQNLGIRSMHFMCGPINFMNAIESALFSMGLDKSRVIKESFTVAATPPPASAQAGAGEKATLDKISQAGSSASDDDFNVDDGAVVIGNRAKISAPESITATVDGDTHTVPYKPGKTVLECLLEADLNPPYSCLDGACMACIAKVQDGTVYQNDMGILTEDNVEQGECLTCQARPCSKNLKVTYEIF